MVEKQNTRSIVWMCAAATLICALYAGFLANKTFPPTEGWYSYYAYLINEQGAVPYLDFELLFPPLYVLVIALFTRVFGYEILALRVLGVVFFALLGLVGALIFERLTKNTLMGLLGGVLAAAVVQSEAVQIFYDYIRLMDLCVFAAVYFFLRYFEKERGGEKAALAGTVFAVLAALCKQSSGLVFLLFCFAAVAFFVILEKSGWQGARLLLWMGGVALLTLTPMVGYLVSKGALGAFLRSGFVSSLGAKGGGGVLSLLFGWIARSAAALGKGLLVILLLAVLLVLWERLRRRYPARTLRREWHCDRRTVAMVTVVLIALALLPFLLPVWGELLSLGPFELLQYVVFLCCVLLFAALGLYGVWKRESVASLDCVWRKYLFLSGTVVALGFSVGMSGGLVRSQLALGYSLILLLLFFLAARYRRTLACYLVLGVMLWQTAGAFALKVRSTYNWWGLSTGNYYEQTYTTEVPLLRGLRMSKDYAQMYDNIWHAVRSHSTQDEPIFVFPHMPVLYLALERPRATSTAVQWFDVASDAAVRSDIERLRLDPPRVLVLCHIDSYVIESHERAFRGGNESGLSQMQAFLSEFVVSEGYERLTLDTVPFGYEISVWALADAE